MDCQAQEYSLFYLLKFRFQRRVGIVRAALLFVGFYGILLAERRCPASAAVMLSPDVKSGGSSISVVLRTVRMFLHEIPKGGNPLWIF